MCNKPKTFQPDTSPYKHLMHIFETCKSISYNTYYFIAKCGKILAHFREPKVAMPKLKYIITKGTRL